MSALGSKSDLNASARMSSSAGCGQSWELVLERRCVKPVPYSRKPDAMRVM
jgi:hypothetical protein